MRVAILALLAAVGLAQEKPADRERIRITLAEWDTIVRELQEGPQTTIKKLAAIKVQAGWYMVAERGKIVDIRPAKDEGIEVVAWTGFGANRTFQVAASEAKIVEEWRKWDRLRWWSVPAVAAGRATLKPIYLSVYDLNRTPNPGIKWPKIKQAKVRYKAWFNALARALKPPRPYFADGRLVRPKIDWQKAWRLVDRHRLQAFPFEATVIRRSDYSISVKVLPGGAVRTVPIYDPQIIDAVPAGTQVLLACFPDTDATNRREFKAQRGKWNGRWVLWRIRAAAAK